MATRRWPRQMGWLFRLVILSIAGVQVIASTVPQPALAQSVDDPWAVPLNLSHSGAATNPSIMIDSESVVHAVWLDDLKRYVYARFDGSGWSQPEQTNLHVRFGLPDSMPSPGQPEALLYTGPNPVFLAGHGQYIIAFWLTPDGELYTSRVLNRNFKDVTAWRAAKLLTSSAAYFSVGIDARGVIHLSYLRTSDISERPAGVYYLRSTNSGLDWSASTLLYESPYLRNLIEGEANLSLATAGTADSPQVYIAWDNSLRKQVLLTRSLDGGTSWEQPVEIAGPAQDSGLARPFNIQVGAMENSAVVVWQSANQEGACTHFYQSSSDAGATWSKSQSMAKELRVCALANEFVASQAASPGKFLYMLTDSQNQVFLSAWDGFQWSEPQSQPVLSGFEDPEIFTQVEYDCRRAALFSSRLNVVGCDKGRGGDIWLTSLDLQTTEHWFSTPVWSQPALITEDELDVAAVELTATEDNLIHAVYSQRQDTAIYYTRWDGVNWSRVTPVMQLPDGEAGRPVIASGPGNELFLITRSSRGLLYFSRAKSSDAVTSSGWSTPTLLPTAHNGMLSQADITWDTAGTIYVAYSVPVNDERGVYLVQSNDHGKTWSDPLLVFDGAAAKFDLVGPPSVLVSNNSLIQIIWREYSIQVDGVSLPLSLYSARSEDAGNTFNETEIVADAPVTWGEIAADGKGTLHRLWQQQDGRSPLWNQISYDMGRSWQVVQLLPAEVETAAVIKDPGGRLHLLGVGGDTLSHWLWNENRWQAEAPLLWSTVPQGENSMEMTASAAVNGDGKMVVVLTVAVGSGGTAQRHLFYSTRTFDEMPEQAAAVEPATLPVASPMPSPTAAPPDRPVEPVATVSSSSIDLQDPIEPGNDGGSLPLFVKALFPVVILLLVVLGVVFRRVTRVNDR